MFAFKPRRWAAATALSLCLPALAFAAVGDHLWSAGFAAEGQLDIDGSDAFVTHGTFFGTVNLGGSDMTSVNFFDGDQYLARFDAAGNHLWSQQFSPVGPGASNECVAVDPAGNSYITGYVFNTGSIDFGGGAINGPQLYIAKFDANGVHQWSAGFGNGYPRAITADGSHVLVTGFTSSGVDFGGGTIGTAGGNDAFVAELTAAGGHSWSASFGDASDQGGFACAFDGGGNAIVVGSAFGTIDLGGGPVVANGLDLFLAKFDGNGTHQWSSVFDGTFTPGGGILVSTSVTTGPSGEVLLSAELVGSVDLGGGTLTSNGFGDAILAKFDASGAHQWSAIFGSTNGTDNQGGVAVDSAGNVLAGFRIAGDVDFGGGTLTHTGQSWDGNIVVALYDGAGAHLYSNNFGIALTATTKFNATDQIMVSGYSSTGIDMGGGTISPSQLYVAELEGLSAPPTAVGPAALRASFQIDLSPNPFNPRTVIDYTLNRDGIASVVVHDVRGRFVTELVPSRHHTAGRYTVPFLARASGVYYVSVVGDGVRQSVKAIAVK